MDEGVAVVTGACDPSPDNCKDQHYPDGAPGTNWTEGLKIIAIHAVSSNNQPGFELVKASIRFTFDFHDKVAGNNAPFGFRDWDLFPHSMLFQGSDFLFQCLNPFVIVLSLGQGLLKGHGVWIRVGCLEDVSNWFIQEDAHLLDCHMVGNVAPNLTDIISFD